MPEIRISSAVPPSADWSGRIVYVVDDDELVRAALTGLLRSIDLDVRAFASTEEFLAAPKRTRPSCLVLDVRLRGQSGIAFQESLLDTGGPKMPIIFITAHGDIAMTVKAMKAGAIDFLTKPFRDQDMIDAVVAALDHDAKRLKVDESLLDLRECWESLTPRERDVLQHVAAGLMNKQVAGNMGIAEITAKIHRGQAMRKMQCRSVAELVRKLSTLGIGLSAR
ncbi:MAG: response regulator [Burkholderia sp.]|jgi:FixJ family two-component response regulator|uniref:response regulator transcription factor n=1 Tax=Burkholderia sp. TaxID=36773 RepID=UPI0028346BD0|nr:response regulator [Burkholderia sp.]MDR0243341.1 response regulator [Burkholderia sp.]